MCLHRFGGMAIAKRWVKIETNDINIKRCVMESSETKQALFWVWVITALVILFSLVFSGRGYARYEDYYSDLSRSERRIANDMERRYLRRNGRRCLRFKGDTEIDRDESIKGDIVVLKGTVEIDGEIDGNVLSLFGDVELGENAYVTGEVISVNGKVWRDRESVVRGDIVETDLSESRRHRYSRDEDDRAYVEKRSRRQRDRNPCRHVDSDFPRPLITYDRVDGLTLGVRLPTREWWRCKRHQFAVLGKGGYSFASKRWQYQVGLERGIVEDFGLSIGAELHDVTETEDRWIIDDEENSLAAALLKEDFRDYYRRDGYSVYRSGKQYKLGVIRYKETIPVQSHGPATRIRPGVSFYPGSGADSGNSEYRCNFYLRFP
jgi:cytoskeletal protein CcmA (bactofilin family)